jgi:hypothetical protein
VVRLVYGDGTVIYEGFEPFSTPEKEAALEVLFLLAHPTGAWPTGVRPCRRHAGGPRAVLVQLGPRFRRFRA